MVKIILKLIFFMSAFILSSLPSYAAIYKCTTEIANRPSISGPLVAKAYVASFYQTGFYYRLDGNYILISEEPNSKLIKVLLSETNTIKFNGVVDTLNSFKPVTSKIALEITSNKFILDVIHVGVMDGSEQSQYRGSCKEITNNIVSPSKNLADYNDSENKTIEELTQKVANLEHALKNNESTHEEETLGILVSTTQESQTNFVISGKISNRIALANLTINGNHVLTDIDGSFSKNIFVPRTGLTVDIVAINKYGDEYKKTIELDRNVSPKKTQIVFDALNPSAKYVKNNDNAIALIIGVSNYKRTSAKAIYADKDAQTFYDYALLKLGIPEENIKELINENAEETEMLLAVQTWLTRSIKQDQTDVYVFFAGHGLASDDGQNMYLLPYDGLPEFLDDTAFSRDRLFSDIASANPRSVTVFLDTCYSGSTRGSEMLIAARPILLKAKDSAVPEGFTVFTAAAGDETAKPLEEAKHGMFSYFLMKGMEGDADTNSDKQITAGELHAYVKSNVVQQSSGTQTPELQGNADRVLVRFQ